MTAMIVGLFLVGPLLIVPLGMRLIPSLGDGLPDDIMRGVRRVALPAGLLLALAFALPTGPWAAALAVPWLLAAGLAALAAGIAALRTIRQGRGRRPGPEYAVWAALAFLVVGAGNAVADRAGVQPFGFSPTIVLLTAVHFTFAGFALTLVGVLADLARPSRHHVWAFGALIVGIPITAVGFLGIALAAWLGAMSVALGGFGIGLAVFRAAGVLRTGGARALARLAGLTLLVSMPLAAVYAMGAWLGIAWLDLPTMARTHGFLNVVGFAIPAMVAWTIDRRTVTGGAADELGSPLNIRTRRLP